MIQMGLQNMENLLGNRRLKETQKLKAFYGIRSRQMRRYYDKAAKMRKQTNVALVQTLETRLDNMVYRMGFAGTLRAARQMVVHSHFIVSGKKVNKPGYQLNPGEVVQLREKSLKIDRYKDWYNFFEQKLGYIQRDTKNFSGTLLHIPEREEIPIEVEDQLVVEFMAR